MSEKEAPTVIPEFSFGQVEAVCAALNRIADDKRVAFMGRLKQLQKQKLTNPESRPGRGKAGTYTFGDLMRFVIALELIQAGIMPQMAARLVNGSWDVLRMNIYTCSFTPEDTIGFSRKPTEYLWMLSVEALRGLTSEGEGEWDHMERIMAVPIQEAAKQLARGVGHNPEAYGEGWRTLVLNGYNLTQRVMRVVAFHFGYASRVEMRAGIEAEIQEFNEDVRWLGRSLRDMPQPTHEQEKRMEAARERFRELDEADWSTSPPTPRHVLVQRADELVPLLPQPTRDFLSGPAQDSFQIDEGTREMVAELISLNVLTVEEFEYDGDEAATMDEAMKRLNRVGIAFTPFGRILAKRLGGGWGKAFEEADQSRPNAEIDHQADELIERLAPDMLEKIKGDGNIFAEPYRSELLALGLIEFKEADFPFSESGSWTELGRAVSFALRFGRHRHPAERKLGGQ